MEVGELHADALGDHPFLAAGSDEQQIFLAVVVEAEILCGLAGGRRPVTAAKAAGAPCTAARRLARDEGMHALHRIDRDAAAEPQAADQLAVIHRKPAEGGLRHAHAAAKIGDVSQECVAQWTTFQQASP